MSQTPIRIGDKVVFSYEHLQSLFNSLIKRSFLVIGPTVLDSAIVYGELTSVNELPIGFVKDNSPGIVTMKNLLGTNRIVDMISGEQLPRNC